MTVKGIVSMVKSTDCNKEITFFKFSMITSITTALPERTHCSHFRL